MLQLLVKKPEDRLGMPTCLKGNIREHPFFKVIDWVKLENRQVKPPFEPKVVSVNIVTTN